MAAMAFAGGGCDSSEHIEQSEFALGKDIISSGLWAVGMDELDATKGPLFDLRVAPEKSMEAWALAYEDAAKDEDLKFALLFLLSEMCLPEAEKALTDIAMKSLPGQVKEPLAHHEIGTREKAEIVQEAAMAALGRISGDRCDKVNAGTGISNDAIELLVAKSLFAWTSDTTLPFHTRRIAGEALLRDHSVLSVSFRAGLTEKDEWMLTPFSERQVFPSVVDVEPDPRVDPGEQEDNPIAITGACRNKVDNKIFERVISGDSFASLILFQEGGYNVPPLASGEVVREYYDFMADFEHGKWDEGFGWWAPSDSRKPFKRVVNSLWLLETASSTPAPFGDFSGEELDWAFIYIALNNEEYEASCSEDGLAYTTGANSTLCYEPFCDSRTELRFPHFSENIALRASTLLHEAKHAAGDSHDDSDCPRGASCDDSFNQRTSNTMQVRWLEQLARRGKKVSRAMKVAALSRANGILRKGFNNCPNLQINNSGYFSVGPGMCI